MDLIDWLGYMAADIEVIPKLRKLVAERRAAGMCLKCDSNAARRGLCQHHYHQFRMAKLQTAKNRRAAFEAQSIRSGELLPDRQGQRPEIVAAPAAGKAKAG